MSKTQTLFSLIVAIIVVGGAYVHGRITDRWVNEVSDQLATFTDRMNGIPPEFGNWISQEVPINEEEFKASNCHGVFQRAYKNIVTDQVVNVFLTSGKGYHVTIHTPDYCYVAAGYEMGNPPENYTFGVTGLGQPEVLNTLFKQVTSTETNHLRILWTYTFDGNWQAPKLAKYSLGNKPALYKLYLIADVTGSVPPLAEDATVAFAKDFLPVLNPILFPTGEPTVDATTNPGDSG